MMTESAEMAARDEADSFAAVLSQLSDLLQQRVTDAPRVGPHNIVQIVEGVISVAAQRTAELEKARQENRDLRELIRRVV